METPSISSRSNEYTPRQAVGYPGLMYSMDSQDAVPLSPQSGDHSKLRGIEQGTFHKIRARSVWRLTCIAVGLALSVSALSACNNDKSSGVSYEATSVASATTAVTTSTAATTTTTAYGAITIPGVGYCNADDNLRVRSGPGTDYNGIGGLERGEKVSIVGQEGDWYKIVFKDGYAYVSAQFIQASEPAVITTTTAATTAGSTTTTTAAQ